MAIGLRRVAFGALVASIVSLVPVVASVAPAAAADPVPFVTAVPGGRLNQVVVAGSLRAYATQPAANAVVVVSLTTGKLEASIPVGTYPTGLDLSADQRFLYVANSGANDVSVVDLAARREVGRIPVPARVAPVAGYDRPVSVAVANNGTALVATAGVFPQIVQVDLLTGQRVVRDDTPLLWDTASLRASADRSRVGLITARGFAHYVSATNTFVAGAGPGGSSVALDGTGARSFSSASAVFDRDVVLRATVEGNGYGVALNHAGTVGFRVTADKVEVIDAIRGLVTGSIPLPEPLGLTGSGQVGLTLDGTTLVVGTASGLSAVAVTSAVPRPGCTLPTTPRAVVPICDGRLHDVVIDRSGRAYASNAARNQIEVASLTTGTREAAILVGSQPAGLALSVDGNALYVANSGGHDVSVVDLLTQREVRRITIPLRPVSMAVAANGSALVATMFDNGSTGLMYEMDLWSGSVTERRDFDAHGYTSDKTRMRASGDHTRIGIADASAAPAQVFLYDVATDEFTRSDRIDTFVFEAALDRTASNLLVSPRHLLDGDLTLRATLDLGDVPAYGGFGGVAMNAVGTTGYGALTTTVAVVDVGSARVVRELDLPEPTGPNRAAVALSPDEATLAVLTANGVSLVSTGTMTQDRPYAQWTQPSGDPLDGIGTWIAVAADPSATSGPVRSSYLFGTGFEFTGSDASGSLALLSDPAGKFALFNVAGPGGVDRSVGIRFDWHPDRLYFLLAYQLGPGRWGAWVYDHAAAAWTVIGEVTVPAEWGRLAPETTTTVQWYGLLSPTCSGYPRADVFVYPPIGYVGPVSVNSVLSAVGEAPGDCPGSVVIEPSPWARYRVGG